jgi:hypothetical protein
MIILITGMFRSGSTWGFNVVVRLLEAAYPNASVYCCADDSITRVRQTAGGANFIVMKGHHPDNEGFAAIRNRRVKLVHTVRDPIDALRSGMRAFPALTDGLGLIRRSFDIYDEIVSTGYGCVVFYDDIERTPASLVTGIATHLGVSIESTVRDAIVTSLRRDVVKKFTDAMVADREGQEKTRELVDIGFSYYDSKTLFHRSHVSAPEDRTPDVAPAQTAEVIDALRPYVDDSGRLLFRSTRFY